MAKLTHYTRLFAVAIIVLFLDQFTKFWVLINIEPGTYIYPEPVSIIDGWFYLVHIYNTGAAWGAFAGGSFWLGLLAIAVIIAIFVFRNNLELNRHSMQYSIGLLLGGIIGNLIDRFYHGHVIDFIDIHLPGYRWPAFNIADIAIFLGVAIYLILVISDSKKSKST